MQAVLGRNQPQMDQELLVYEVLEVQLALALLDQSLVSVLEFGLDHRLVCYYGQYRLQNMQISFIGKKRLFEL